MTTRLTAITVPVIKDFSNRLKNRKGERVTVAEKTNIDVTGYEKSLKAEFERQILVGVKSARRDLNAKLDIFAKGKEKADLKADFADDKKDGEIIPKGQRAAIDAQARQQAKTHKDEIEKIILFETVNAEANQLTDAQLTRAIESKVDVFVTSPRIATTARTITTQNLNKARAALFTDDSVKKTVKALQYSAVIDRATTPICRSLDGIVFSFDNASNFTYTPPNHFNCRSILVPITQFEPAPKVTSLRPDPNNPGLVDKDGNALSVNEILKSKNLEEPDNLDNYL
jgi:SPP1 gp7 family putative phage head morphogenesis protein